MDTEAAAVAYVEAQPDFAGLWFDESILNVRFTGDLARHESELRAIWGGPLCVSAADHTRAQLLAIQSEIEGPDVVWSSTNEAQGVVDVQVLIATPALQAEYDAEYGDGVVRLTGWFQPT
jgi:hypothetical protein